MISTRILTLAIAFPIVAALFIILGVLVLRKDSRYWGNRFFAMFFWAVAITLIFNLAYLFAEDADAYIATMNLITIETAIVSITGLLLGVLVIFKGEEAIVRSKKIFFIIGIVIALIIVQVCIPGAVYVVDNDPRWSVPMGVYELIFSQSLIVAVYYFSFAFYKELTPEMRTKFRRYLIGLTFLDITLISITIENLYIFGESYAMIGAALNFCIVIGAILIYYGIVRK